MVIHLKYDYLKLKIGKWYVPDDNKKYI